MIAPLPRESITRAWRRTVSAPTLAALLALGGCGHRDPFDATLDWMHQYQGGVIAQQRPPPPNVHDPYPAVGLTPTSPPVLPSEALRQSLTENLVEQRNLAHREGAEIGPLTVAPLATAPTATPPAAKPPTGAPATAPSNGAASPGRQAPAEAGASSATLVAADAPPAPATPPPASTARPPAPADASGGAGAGTGNGTPQDEALVGLPEVGANVGGLGGKPVAPPGAPPEIPALPPAAPNFPGFAVPSDSTLPTPLRPDYALADPNGTRIRFPVGTDQPLRGQDGTISTVARQNAAGPLFVHGYGEASSTDPAEQAQAMTLALLRARAVADLLVAHGVPARAIHLRGHPFGDGVRISTLR
jgi:hypothetical protein